MAKWNRDIPEETIGTLLTMAGTGLGCLFFLYWAVAYASNPDEGFSVLFGIPAFLLAIVFIISSIDGLNIMKDSR